MTAAVILVDSVGFVSMVLPVLVCSSFLRFCDNLGPRENLVPHPTPPPTQHKNQNAKMDKSMTRAPENHRDWFGHNPLNFHSVPFGVKLDDTFP